MTKLSDSAGAAQAKLGTKTVYQTTLPRSHSVILSTEADLWGVGKGEFLTMLLRRRVGEVAFPRPKHAPSYMFSKKVSEEVERYAWYVHNQDIPKLEADRLNWGNLPVSNWVVSVLNEWIWQPRPVDEARLPRQLPAALPPEAFRPPLDAPAEPYWAIFEVDEDENPTGNIWSLKPADTVLFETKEEAESAITLMLPAGALLGKPGVGWSVRGLSRQCLTFMRGFPEFGMVKGEMKDDGQLLAYPLR